MYRLKISSLLIQLFFTFSASSEILHGRSKRFDWQDDGLVQWSSNCDFTGNDLKNLPSDGATCGPGCAATSGCSAFTWTNFNGGTCWMKKGSISTGQAVSNSGAICGVVKPFTGTTAGITTRYWDCCKPSCSWNGKASVTSPVATCQKDGVTKQNDVNAANGCGGGSAFVCTNQQPWVSSNPNLSYGFAAAALSGQSESNFCCQCYALQFSNGKILIVQATNTGGDVQGNQFDIQTPGGGVGIFNGCQSQWGAGPQGWGQQYGGVTSRQACSTLPQQLQAGCFWRFDWLGDNPSMNFKPVNCPQVLTDKTGCVRH